VHWPSCLLLTSPSSRTKPPLIWIPRRFRRSHLATSHEMLMAMPGHFFGIDPLYCYQVVGHAITAFSIPFILYWCVRSLDGDRWAAAVGAAFGVAFLLLDNAGFGHGAFGRMWQGKTIVWILVLPVAISLADSRSRRAQSGHIGSKIQQECTRYFVANPVRCLSPNCGRISLRHY
jgi:hypothetical protein